MKRLFALATIAALASPAWSQPAPTGQPPKPAAPPTTPAPAKPAAAKTDKAMMDPNAAWEAAAKPGPEHDKLKWFEGTWQVETTDLMSESHVVDKGEMTCKMVMGGRFLEMDYEGKYHGKFFHGAGYLGYSNADKHYENFWIDTAGTAMSFMSGSVDAAGKVFTFMGDMTDPMSGQKAQMKEVLTITGKDMYKSDLSMIAGGKETKLMSISYLRGKSGDKMEPVKGGMKPAPDPAGGTAPKTK